MKKFLKNFVVLIIVGLGFGFFGISKIQAANYPLEIIQPQPSLTTANRYYKAYPNFEYNVRVGVIGGLYPYTFALTNAPAGMTINSSTGVIIWPNPTTSGSPHGVMVSVTDSEGTVSTRSWTITVNVNNTYFLDAVNGQSIANGGAGTITNPWKDLVDLRNGGASVGSMVYFRNGTYTLTDIPYSGESTGSGWYRTEWSTTNHPLIWLNYPGENPVVNFGFEAAGSPHDAPTQRLGGGDIYIEGITFTNGDIMFFQLGGTERLVVRKNIFQNLLGGTNGSNSSALMFLSGSPRGKVLIAENDFHHIYGATVCDTTGAWGAPYALCFPHGGTTVSPGSSGIKLYDIDRVLIEKNILYDIYNGVEGIAVKGATMTNVYIRGNTLYDIENRAIDGNQHTVVDLTVEFNLVKGIPAGQPGVIINHDGLNGRTYIYRNTFDCRVQFNSTSIEDGPFELKQNVIVNSDITNNGLYYNGSVDSSRLTKVDDLVGLSSDNIIDANGNLTPAYSSYLGTRGYQILEGAPPPPPPPPTPKVGDLNNDTFVDISDYNIFVGNFGRTGSGISGDIDLNGAVNIFDYNLLVGNFGR